MIYVITETEEDYNEFLWEAGLCANCENIKRVESSRKACDDHMSRAVMLPNAVNRFSVISYSRRS